MPQKGTKFWPQKAQRAQSQQNPFELFVLLCGKETIE
jgi:hypothetical protein